MPADARQLNRRAFDRAAPTYDAAAALAREVASRMRERLRYIKLDPKAILDAGCATGADSRELQILYPHANVIAVDFSLAMLATARRASADLALVCADIGHLPLPNESVAMIWCNFALQWSGYSALAEMHRALAPGGLFMFSALGPDTLKELRRAWRAGDARVDEFIDMHELGDYLVENGFAAPVMEREDITLTYPTARNMMAELKAQGALNLNQNRRRRGLGGKARLCRALNNYDAGKRDGRVPATFEVIYAHAWKPEPARADLRPIKMYARRTPDV